MKTVIMRGTVSNIGSYAAYDYETGNLLGYSDSSYAIEYDKNGTKLEDAISVKVVKIDESAWM